MANNFNTLYLLNYNNYYNRMVKKELSLIDYAEYIVSTLQNINFNPGDGVDTTQIVSTLEGTHPDYLIVADGQEIVSRWFIVDAPRLRSGQYELQLHRDGVADKYEDVLNAPCFIEKATLDNADPMIFNKEDMTYNQIKTEQTLLEENQEGVDGWIVGYVADDFLNNEDKTIEVEVPISANTDITYEEILAYNDKFFNPTVTMYVGVRYGTFENYQYDQAVVNNLGQKSFKRLTYTAPYSYTVSFKGDNQLDAIETALKATYKNQYSAYITSDNILQYNGKICRRESNNKLYSIKIEKVRRSSIEPTTGVLGTRYVQEMANINIAATTNSTSCVIEGDAYQITLTEVFGQTVTGTILTSTKKLKDAPYYMFCSQYYKSTSSKILTFMTNFAKGLGSALYDIQILPYKPFFNYADYTEFTYTQGGIKDTYWTIYWCTESSFTTQIPFTKTIQDYKVESECDMYRICSPNGAGVFEFNAAKNGGINGFTANCTYKPFNPYINIVPNFNGLYGTNFQDYRGLICQGDFSMPRINDQWIEYQLQNKNFQASFDRQIESMELQNKAQKTRDIVNAFTGSLQGAIAGGTVGGLSGMPMATGIGAAVGAVASAGGGIADIAINEKLRNDALDLAKDQFGYNLGNIQARPNTLSKTGSMNIDNPYIPYLEYYTCTEQEKEALRNKIKYNGMTVMRIGKIVDYIKNEPTFIKGKIIRFENLEDDYHLAKSIAQEINKGVFI